MYRAIIFDFFDVIHRDPFQFWLKESGLQRRDEYQEASNLVDLGEINEHEFYERLAKFSGQQVNNVEGVFEDTIHVDTELVELIQLINKTHKVGLISNCSVEYIEGILYRHQLHNLFDDITISAALGIIKPDPRIFQHSLIKLGVRPQEAVFVDDNPTNTEAASAIGITGITHTTTEDLKRSLTALNIKLAG